MIVGPLYKMPIAGRLRQTPRAIFRGNSIVLDQCNELRMAWRLA
jgi:hypothetical protein